MKERLAGSYYEFTSNVFIIKPSQPILIEFNKNSSISSKFSESLDVANYNFPSASLKFYLNTFLLNILEILPSIG